MTLTLQDRDRQFVWHPLTQHQTAFDPIPIARGEGAYLYSDNNKRYLDLISSWWVNLHGHGHPAIAAAIYEQAKTMEQVIFAGFTHEPAVQLAEQLLPLLPFSGGKVFYSDNGSTAVEVALKIAYQYWCNQDQPQRQRFVGFDGGYHGDTIGAMSVSKSTVYSSPYAGLLFEIDVSPYPATWIGDNDQLTKEQAALTWFEDYLAQRGDEVAAIIIEPLVQGASGMNMCSERFLREVERIARMYHVLIIYDEVMVGFGRTGELFACKKAKTAPDLICLSKGLTAGFLPMSVTVCTETIYRAFLGDTLQKAFLHGHSFTANPLGCAAALTSLKLLQSDATQQQIRMITEVHQQQLLRLAGELPIEKMRQCGTIAAFDLQIAATYGSARSKALQQCLLNKGLLLRPLGNTIYLLPPYCIQQSDLIFAYDTLVEELKKFLCACPAGKTDKRSLADEGN